MKRILINGLVLVIFVCGVAWAAYAFGHRRGFELGTVHAQMGTFIGTFDALQKIRGGDIQAGTRRIEESCFLAADTVYSDYPDTRFVAKTFLDDFRHYRQTYRTNSADWSPLEQNLEIKLADWK